MFFFFFASFFIGAGEVVRSGPSSVTIFFCLLVLLEHIAQERCALPAPSRLSHLSCEMGGPSVYFATDRSPENPGVLSFLSSSNCLALRISTKQHHPFFFPISSKQTQARATPSSYNAFTSPACKPHRIGTLTHIQSMEHKLNCKPCGFHKQVPVRWRCR